MQTQQALTFKIVDKLFGVKYENIHVVSGHLRKYMDIGSAYKCLPLGGLYPGGG